MARCEPLLRVPCGTHRGHVVGRVGQHGGERQVLRGQTSVDLAVADRDGQQPGALLLADVRMHGRERAGQCRRRFQALIGFWLGGYISPYG